MSYCCGLLYFFKAIRFYRCRMKHSKVIFHFAKCYVYSFSPFEMLITDTKKIFKICFFCPVIYHSWMCTFLFVLKMRKYHHSSNCEHVPQYAVNSYEATTGCDGQTQVQMYGEIRVCKDKRKLFWTWTEDISLLKSSCYKISSWYPTQVAQGLNYSLERQRKCKAIQ